MSELLNMYADADFIASLVDLSPFIGAGVLVGVMCAVLGWMVGAVIVLARFDIR